MAGKVVFTDERARRLKPPAKGRLHLCDAKQPALELIVTAAGSKNWYLNRWYNGKAVRVRLEGFPEANVTTARKLAAAKIAEQDSGVDLQAEKRKKRTEPTLGDLWSHWELYAAAHKKPLSAKYDKQNYGKHWKPWEARRLSAITRSDVQARHAEIGRECGPYAANRALALLRAMYNQADQLGYRGENPCLKIKTFKETSRDRFLQPSELARFFAAVETENETFRDFFWCCLLTGARKSNVLTMKWVDVDLAAGHWWIREQKGGVPVLVPLVPELLTILQRRHAVANGSPWVFAGHRVGDHLREPREAWKRICTAAGIEDLHVHDLRRSLGSWMAGANVSLPIIGKMLGHSTAQATMIYSRLAVDPVRAAAEKATTAMIAAGGAAAKKLLGGPEAN